MCLGWRQRRFGRLFRGIGDHHPRRRDRAKRTSAVTGVEFRAPEYLDARAARMVRPNSNYLYLGTVKFDILRCSKNACAFGIQV